MSEGLITAVAYISSVIGLGATAAYAVSFYLTTYNELYLPDQSNYDDTDLSYTLAIVECALSGATFIIGLLAFAASKNPVKRVLLVASLFFGIGFIMEGTFGVIRGWNLGFLGDDMARTCSDVDKSGCPTTRYESLNDREIQFREPKGGECQFWFWPPMKPRYTLIHEESACNGYGTLNICDQKIETLMDWSAPSSYGWRDDPGKIADAAQGNIVTMDKQHNMKLLLALQESVITSNNNSIPVADRYTKQPSIAYCWYWGCSEVCQPHRFHVNRWWLLSSCALCFLHFICLILSLVSWRRAPLDTVDKAKMVEKMDMDMGMDMERQLNFIVPQIGRRKRRLVQNPELNPELNPEGLQF
jgi:hypothetical protein